MLFSAVQQWSLVLPFGNRGIATLVGQDVEVFLTNVGFVLTTFSRSVAAVRDAVSFVSNAVPLVRDALGQPFGVVHKTVQQWSPVVALGDRSIATVIGQHLEVLLTDVGLLLTISSQSISPVREAVSFVSNAVSFDRDAVPIARTVTAQLRSLVLPGHEPRYC